MFKFTGATTQKMASPDIHDESLWVAQPVRRIQASKPAPSELIGGAMRWTSVAGRGI